MTFQHDTSGHGHNLLGVCRKNYTEQGLSPKRKGVSKVKITVFALAIVACLFLLFACANVPEHGTVTGKRVDSRSTCVKYTGAGHHRKCAKKGKVETYVVTVSHDGEATDVTVDAETYNELQVGSEWANK